jgi:hypothetical protein
VARQASDDKLAGADCCSFYLFFGRVARHILKIRNLNEEKDPGQKYQ